MGACLRAGFKTEKTEQKRVFHVTLCLNYSLLLESVSLLSLLFLFKLCTLVGFRRQADSSSSWAESSALR